MHQRSLDPMSYRMSRPKSELVETIVFLDGTERPYKDRNNYFFATVPGLPDGRPHVFCSYHYRSSMVKETKNGITTRTYKIWWEPSTWITYNPLQPRTQFTILSDIDLINRKAYWDNYIKMEHCKPSKKYSCYST